MSRKKEVKFIPSKYQQKIFDFIEHGQGHLIVEAAAGSGKTSTIVKSIELIPKDKKILLVAFNKDIVKELEKKTNGFDNVYVRTLHGLGYLMLRRNMIDKGLIPDEFKYASHITNNIKQYASINTYNLKRREYFRYIENIKKYVDFARFYLCKSLKDLDFIEDRYNIETIADEKEVTLKVLEWGKNALETIDYTDMIWLPNEINLKPLGLLFDFIFVDECQDLNRAERELVLRCFKMGTRLVSVGDTQQCLYGFAGSDPDSFNELKKIPNTTCLPLSMSYRCGKNIVNLAKTIVPSIEYNEASNNDGRIVYDVSLEDIQDGDMILCRNNAPLIQVYNEFLKLGKKSYIRGKDIGRNLKNIVKSTKQQELNVDCLKDGVFARLYDDLFMTRNKLIERCGIDQDTAMKSQQIQNKLDMIKALEILSEGINTSEEIMSKIDEIFPKRDKKDGISLSTIHKAKGLEADNVFIACKSLMPSKSAEKDWEIKQEYNLMYVAYTRAKNTLGFINEKDFEQFDTSNTTSIDKLKRIEIIVNKTLGKTTTIIVNKNNAKSIVDMARNINTITLSCGSTIDLSNNKKINSFKELVKNKKRSKLKR